jgi:hypothetical protein
MTNTLPDSNVETEVFCTLQVEGTHCWSTCDIEEVNYLRYTHRHVFHIKAHVTVTHSDRDVEFIRLKHQITKYLRDAYFNEHQQLHVFGMKSCEMLGIELMREFGLSRIEVDEDHENGAVVKLKQQFLNIIT